MENFVLTLLGLIVLLSAFLIGEGLAYLLDWK